MTIVIMIILHSYICKFNDDIDDDDDDDDDDIYNMVIYYALLYFTQSRWNSNNSTTDYDDDDNNRYFEPILRFSPSRYFCSVSSCFFLWSKTHKDNQYRFLYYYCIILSFEFRFYFILEIAMFYLSKDNFLSNNKICYLI